MSQSYQTPLENINVNVQRGASVLQGLPQQSQQQFVSTSSPIQNIASSQHVVGSTTFLPPQPTFTSAPGSFPPLQQQVFSSSPLQYSSGSQFVSSGAPLATSPVFAKGVYHQQPVQFVAQPIRQEVLVNEEFREYGENVVMRVVSERSIFPERIEVMERDVYPEPMIQVRDIHTGTTEIEKEILHVYPVKLEKEIVNIHPTLIEKEITHVQPTRVLVAEQVIHPEQIKHSVEERTHEIQRLQQHEQEVLPTLVQHHERQVYAQDFNLVQQKQTLVSSPIIQSQQSFVTEAIPSTTTFVPTTANLVVEEVPLTVQTTTTTTTTEKLSEKDLAREQQYLAGTTGGIPTQNMVR